MIYQVANKTGIIDAIDGGLVATNVDIPAAGCPDSIGIDYDEALAFREVREAGL
jgi:hypothetical protein